VTKNDATESHQSPSPSPAPGGGAGESDTTDAQRPIALRTSGLSKSWGSFKANADISIALPVGARAALIGPNGAGKTTFLSLLAGVYAPDAGDVFLGEERVTKLPQHERVRRGLARTFQINTLFSELTVLESVVLAICERRGLGGRWWRTVASHARELNEANDLLRSLHLEGNANDVTKTLPYGKQRLVEIALALATNPRILLLDEPAAGIPSAESAELFNVIDRLPRDVTILFIEHDMKLVFRFAERIVVLSEGRVLADGAPAQIAADARVKEVYLGDAPQEARDA
jgi:branched-chain amino acid transport system ATP-binding protein